MRRTVYLILDPTTHRAIYVGITTNGKARARQHQANRLSAVYATYKLYDALGIDMDMIPIAEFDNRRDARFLEINLIRHVPGLLNRESASLRNSLCRVKT